MLAKEKDRCRNLGHPVPCVATDSNNEDFSLALQDDHDTTRGTHYATQAMDSGADMAATLGVVSAGAFVQVDIRFLANLNDSQDIKMSKERFFPK